MQSIDLSQTFTLYADLPSFRPCWFVSEVEVRLWILYAHIKQELKMKKKSKIILNGEEMEEVNKFKYLGSVMCKHGGTEG